MSLSAMAEPPESQCPQIRDCPMFGVFTLSGTLRIWQDNYCRSEYTRCARYVRTQRGEFVPRTLMPNGKLLAAKPGT